MDSDGDYTDNEDTLSPNTENVRTTPELERTHSPRGDNQHLRAHNDPLRESITSRSPKKKRVGRSSYLEDEEEDMRKSTMSTGSTINRLFGRKSTNDDGDDGGFYKEPGSAVDPSNSYDPENIYGDNEGEVPVEGEQEGETEEKKKIDYVGKLKKLKPRIPKIKLGGFIPNFGVRDIRTFGDVQRKKCLYPSYKGNSIFLSSKTETRPTVEGVNKQLQKRRDQVQKMQQYYIRKKKQNESDRLGYLHQLYNKDCEEYVKEQNENYRMMDYQLEGIYQGKKPYFARYNEHIVEQRCYRERDRFTRYCDENGSFVSSYDPISRGLYTRPNTFMTEFDEEVPLKKTVPFLSKISRNLLYKQGEQSNEEEEYFQLDVECQKLYFVDHPLMSEEEFCAQKLIYLYNRYRKMSSHKTISYYEKKIEALLTALREHQQLHNKTLEKVSQFDPAASRNEQRMSQEMSSDMAMGYRMSNLRAQLRNARIGLGEEVYSHYQIIQDITTLWNRLRGVRAQQPFWSTSVGVKFRIVPPVDIGKSTEDIQAQVEQEYEEYLEEIEWQKKRLMHEFGKKKAELEDPLTDEEMVEKKREIYDRIISHRLSPSQPTIIPSLVELPIPQDKVTAPDGERLRDLEIAKCQYFLKILINGKKVSSTTAVPLTKSFTIHFGEIIPVIVTKWPETICIEIRKKTSALSSSRIASLFVSAPGLEESSGRAGKRVATLESENENEKQQEQTQQVKGDDDMQGDGEKIPSQPQPPPSKRRRIKKKFEELDFNGTNPFVPTYEERIHIRNLQGDTEEEGYQQQQLYNEGQQQQLGVQQPREHYTSGRCVVRVSWGCLRQGDLPRAPPIPDDPSLLAGFFGRGNHKKMALPTAKDLLNMQKMKRLLEGNTIDPNDPKNTGLLSMFELFRQKKLVRPGFFLTEQDEGIFLIPPKDYQQILREYSEERIRKINEELQLGSDDPSKTKTLTTKEEQQIKEQQQIKSGGASSRMEYVGKYVDEPNLPTNVFKFIKNWVWSIFTPRRPLRPERRSLDEDMIPKFSRGQKQVVKIYCQILSAQNIPIRDPDFQLYANIRNKWLQFAKTKVQQAAGRAAYTTRPLQSGDGYDDGEYPEEDVESGRKEKEFEEFKDRYAGDDNMESILSEHSIEAFCEVFFQGSTAQTTLYHSSSPQIGETLVLPLNVEPHGGALKRINQAITPEQLMNVEDTIYFDFFDMFQAKLGRDDISSVDVLRKEKRYLGTFSLPFSTLFINNGSVAGKFVVSVPLVNHGFIQTPEKPMTFDVCVTLDPPIPLPADIQDIKVSGESPELTTHCKIWVTTKSKFSRTKNRNIMALAPNSSGRGTLLCRYVKAQKPPDDMQTPEQALRFVSLIPCKEDIHQFSERIDVWTNSQKFLDEGGDYEEHAILLCNFLLYMGKKAYVVLGNAFPEGKTCYVFVEGDENRGNRKELWDPSNGVIYDIKDQLCPLYSVGCVFDRFNIWANIQIEEKPYQMNWNLSSRFNWDKLFHSEKKRRKMYNVEVSLQRENLMYKEPNLGRVQRFTRELKDTLRQVHFQLRTSMNEDREEFDGVLEPQLVEMLEYFESRKRENLEVRNDKHQQDLVKLKEKLGDRAQEMFGYPLNFRKLEIGEIVQQVLHNTKFYSLQEKEEVQFCYSVFVKAYTRNVYSIWVYSACVFVIDDMYL